jgi:putative hydrolase of the HAD superfamily
VSSTAPDTREASAAPGRTAPARRGLQQRRPGGGALEAAELLEFFEVVIDSALAGVEKPDPAIFHAALEALGVPARDALYVGDLYDVDVLGARAAGMDAVLFAPGEAAAVAGCRTVRSLSALADYLLPGERAAS